MTKILDLTFIEREERRVEIAPNMYLVFDPASTAEPRSKGLGNYRDDGMKWDHLCSTHVDPVDGPVQKRVALHLSKGHVITNQDPITIEGSLLCGSCKLHGFVRGGKWVLA